MNTIFNSRTTPSPREGVAPEDPLKIKKGSRNDDPESL